jgi:hypothetical protein
MAPDAAAAFAAPVSDRAWHPDHPPVATTASLNQADRDARILAEPRRQRRPARSAANDHIVETHRRFSRLRQDAPGSVSGYPRETEKAASDAAPVWRRFSEPEGEGR